MICKGNKPIDTMYVGSKLVQQVYKGSKKIYPEHGVIPKAIKDSMVLWYDIKRQGATNENMAANPTLRDLSGNGHDATCYNFAWSGMSGVGGYNVGNFTISSWAKDFVQQSGYTFVIDRLEEQPSTFGTYCVRIVVNGSFRVKVEVSDNTTLPIIYNNSKKVGLLYAKENGTYMVNADEVEPTDYVWLQVNKGCYCKYEFLPEYPNAIVSDGVDDYYQTLPTYPKEAGTCFLTAQSLEDDESSYIMYMSDNKEESGFISSWIGTTVGVSGKNRIMLRGVNEEGEEIAKYSSPDSDLSGKGIIVFTWNNNIPLMVGRINDERVELGLEQPHTKYSWGTDFNAGGKIYKKFAFYSFLLFDRDLTEQEIAWVKTNLIEGNDDAEESTT